MIALEKIEIIRYLVFFCLILSILSHFLQILLIFSWHFGKKTKQSMKN